MTKRIYRWNQGTGEVEEILGLSPEVETHAVHEDTLSTPLRHPVTGRIHDSKSAYMKDCAQTGTRVVGNDWVGLEPTKPKDKITDELIMDRIHKAESIHRDPAKARERQNLSRKMWENSQKFMKEGTIRLIRLPEEKSET